MNSRSDYKEKSKSMKFTDGYKEQAVETPSINVCLLTQNLTISTTAWSSLLYDVFVKRSEFGRA